MLKSMRKNMKAIMWVLLTTFVLWGGSSAVLSRSKPTNYAGLVFGKKVGWKEYEQNYSAVQSQAKLMYGEKFDQVKQYLKLEEQAWSRIMLLKEAAGRRIAVSDDEAVQAICQMPLFQDASGKFIPDIYKRVVDYFLRIPARDFEEGIKGTMKIAKLREEIIKDVAVTEDELKERYKEKNEKANVDYVLINAADFKAGIEVNERAVQRYYDGHGEEFKMPLRVNIEYIPFEYSQYQKGITAPAEEEINKHYENHKKDYQKELDEAKQKNISQETTLANIKERVKKQLTEKKAQERASDLASDVSYELAQKGQPEFSAAAKKFGLDVKESGFFSADEPIPGIGPSYAIAFEAFKLAPGEISHPIKGPRGRYIIRLKEKKEPYVPSLSEIKQRIADAVAQEEAKKLADKKSEELLAAVRQKMGAGAAFKNVCAELKLEIKSTGQFTKDGYIPNIGKSDEFANIAFSAEAGKLAGKADVGQGAAIIFVTEKSGIDEEKFKKEKDEFKKTALEEKRAAYFDGWFRKLKEKAGIKIAG